MKTKQNRTKQNKKAHTTIILRKIPLMILIFFPKKKEGNAVYIFFLID
jgi:hypothetical protein